MKPEIKRLWLTALRSGLYRQGEGALNNNQFFCCLGVLCDVYQKQTGDGAWINNNEVGLTFSSEEAGSHSILPKFVQIWAGMSDENPIIEGDKSLAEYNDDGVGFEDIADLIENNL
jgi:hypothetical protein